MEGFGFALLYLGAIAGSGIALLVIVVSLAGHSSRWWLTTPWRARATVDPRVSSRVSAAPLVATWFVIPPATALAFLLTLSGLWLMAVPVAIGGAALVGAVRIGSDKPVWLPLVWIVFAVSAALAAAILFLGAYAVIVWPESSGVAETVATMLISLTVPGYGLVVGWQLAVVAYAQQGARIKAREALGLIPTKELV